MYQTIADLVALAEGRGVPLWRPVLESESALSGLTEDQVLSEMERRLQVMERSAKRALETPLETASGLISGVAAGQHAYAAGGGICGPLINRIMALALSGSEVNAAMGKICAAPTAGACGILPAVLLALGERYQLEREAVLQGLLTASGIGAVIMENATVSGAEGGCQAECGVAAAMAAAAAVQMAGGAPQVSAHAVAFALMNCMGLVCDPVAGLVQVPCAQRNASQAVNAVLSADMALAGMESVIPADQVVEAMCRVGRQLPAALRETALGGIAATPAGRDIAERIHGSE